MKYEELSEIRKMTRKGYTESVSAEEKKGADQEAPTEKVTRESVEAAELGYMADDLGLLPDFVDVLKGCANPVALAGLEEGDTVLVVGCRAGADCLLAAVRVGSRGSVIGVDEAPDEVTAARNAAKAGGYTAVEVRLGEIENLPVEDESVDVAITNCAATFSSDKIRTLKEIKRALKHGGRLVLAEPAVAEKATRDKISAVSTSLECLENGLYRTDYLSILKRAGFKKITLLVETPLPVSRLKRDRQAAVRLANSELADTDIELFADVVTSIIISATKP